MNRKQKIIRNTILLIAFSFLLFTRSYLYLDPLAAHKASERSIHYGPSEVLHVESFPGGKYYLGKYEQWISCNTVNRALGIFWRFGSQVTGIEVNEEKPISYTWSSSDNRKKVYGIVNDKSIDRLEIYLTEGIVLTQEKFYGDMFLLTWESEGEFQKIVSYDRLGAIVFEEESIEYRP